jgi:hypothetical protein
MLTCRWELRVSCACAASSEGPVVPVLQEGKWGMHNDGLNSSFMHVQVGTWPLLLPWLIWHLERHYRR